MTPICIVWQLLWTSTPLTPWDLSATLQKRIKRPNICICVHSSSEFRQTVISSLNCNIQKQSLINISNAFALLYSTWARTHFHPTVHSTLLVIKKLRASFMFHFLFINHWLSTVIKSETSNSNVSLFCFNVSFFAVIMFHFTFHFSNKNYRRKKSKHARRDFKTCSKRFQNMLEEIRLKDWNITWNISIQYFIHWIKWLSTYYKAYMKHEA